MRFASIVLLTLVASAPSAAHELGVVDERPAEGRYVEVDDVFLVPYEATIPGTDVTFWMEPIPGSDTLAPYWIGRTEVTWAEYKPYMALCAVFERFDDAGVRQVTDDNRIDAITAPSKLYDASFTFGSGDEPDLPAVSMTQYAAKQYTKWLSLLTDEFYRLPSEAEWEHAASAGEGDPDDIDAVAWHEDNSDFETHTVAQKAPNAWGVYDTLGNASEWTLDAFEGEPVVDDEGPGGEPPVAWPTKIFPRVLRGGSAFLPVDDATVESRRASDDDTWQDYDPNTPKSPWWFANDDAQDVGFRIVRPYRTPTPERRSRYWDADVARIQKVADFRIDEEGRGERGIVDPDLPAAIEALDAAR